MSQSARDEEPPPNTLAWSNWHAERTIRSLDLTPEELAFALDKGAKIVDFAVRGFWKKHERLGVRHVATAAACAYALAWLEQWAKNRELEG
jgi:hypothetical protein